MRWIGAFLLATAALALTAQVRPEDPCAIAGLVSNASSGEPVRRALVYLRRIDSSPGVTNIQVSQTAMTDAAGRFAIAGIAAGKYRLSAEHNGFIVGQYGARGPGKSGTLITLEAGQRSNDLSIRMTPHGVIAGRVVDEEGEPVTGAEVQVLRQQYAVGRGRQLVRAGGGQSNDLGEYRVFGLAPGRYFLSASSRGNPVLPQSEEDYVTTYFPRTTDASAAAALDLAAGAQLRNIDVRLARLHTVTVSGRVVNELRAAASGVEGQGRTNVQVVLSSRNASGAFGQSQGTSVTQQGTFLFRNVVPGSYFVIGTVMLPQKPISTRTAIQVGSSNLEGLSLTIRNGVPVSGHVRVDGESTESLAQVRVGLQPLEIGGFAFGATPAQKVKDDGTFEMEDVSSDRYLVTVGGLPEGFYVKAVKSASLDVLAGGLEIAGVSPAPLEVVVSPRAGQVSGSVMDGRTQKSASQMTVVIVPQEKERRERWEFYESASSDEAGRFTFKRVTPGEYRVYAWEDVEFGAWMDAGFLKAVESKGEAVSVTEGGRHTVQVNLISGDGQ